MADSESDCSALTDLSSELSSAPSSPKPLSFYMPPFPTPDSSQTQSAYSSSSEQDSRRRHRKDDGGPPLKKRKVAEPKERKTERLDLRSSSQTPLMEQTSQAEILLKALRKKRKIVVVAGAGISTSAGGRPP